MMTRIKSWASLTLLAALAVGFYACSSNEMPETAPASNATLRSTTINQVDSLMFLRDPSGTTVGAFRMYGIKLTDDTNTSLTDTLSTGNTSLGYELYFYNEKVYTSNTQTVSEAVGCPALFLGYGVTGYKTNFTGTAAFDTLSISDVNGTLVSDNAATLPLPVGSPYRYDSGRLIRTYVKSTYYPTFLIGNTFQGLASSAQPIYVINIGDYYYAFMVSRFQNGTTTTGIPATDKQYITLKYKMLN